MQGTSIAKAAQVGSGTGPRRTTTGAARTHDEDDLVAALCTGDEGAFAELVARHHGSLCGAARRYLRDPNTAEDVVQETWVAFLASIARFEGRCAVKTWLFRILFNKAQTRLARDRRCAPFSSLVSAETADDWSAVDSSRFRSESNPVDAGHWAQPPTWCSDPERLAASSESMAIVRSAIDALPKAQGMVMVLRDVEGLSAHEVCAALAISPVNQRVLLHRARSRVRAELCERYGDGV